MELWVFDRSGPCSSGPFDIHDELDKFARAIVGYATMHDDAMGLDTFVEREDGRHYVTLDDASGNYEGQAGDADSRTGSYRLSWNNVL
ncbi:hypothetical protein RJ55_08689 [Drechmeria coniospora]|nr:hypothetical protein RJ55_08689 [Drechmeria coniospora]